MKAPINARLADERTDRVVRSLADAILELQALPCSATQIINDVHLVDSVVALVPHGLGRKPRIVLLSPPRGATSSGRIVELVDVNGTLGSNPDRTKYVAFLASGMGATVTVDIEVK